MPPWRPAPSAFRPSIALATRVTDRTGCRGVSRPAISARRAPPSSKLLLLFLGGLLRLLRTTLLGFAFLCHERHLLSDWNTTTSLQGVKENLTSQAARERSREPAPPSSSSLHRLGSTQTSLPRVESSSCAEKNSHPAPRSTTSAFSTARSWPPDAHADHRKRGRTEAGHGRPSSNLSHTPMCQKPGKNGCLLRDRPAPPFAAGLASLFYRGNAMQISRLAHRARLRADDDCDVVQE